MFLFPAVDLYDGKAVRLLKGDYEKMTVYSENPLSVAKDFQNFGAHCIHLVDLEGARDGNTPNIEIVKDITAKTSLFTEIGGGIRDILTVNKYLSAGVDRVILGTAAVTDESFLIEAVNTYGERIAVGADIRDGKVSIKGWTEDSAYTLNEFAAKMQKLGVQTLICTDISRDGMMRGTNRQLYKDLSKNYCMNITASGGVSSLEDIRALEKLGIYAAIIGKAYYTGALNLKEALEVANDNKAHYSMSGC